MIMKILTLALNLVMARAQAPAESRGFFSNFTTKTVRKAVLMIASFFGGAVLFLGGFFTVLMDMILASQSAQVLALSHASIVGFGLILLSSVTFAVLFSRRVWEIPVENHPTHPVSPQANPIQDAVADLIRDFTEERKLVRKMQLEQVDSADMTGAAFKPSVGTDTGSSANRSAYN